MSEIKLILISMPASVYWLTENQDKSDVLSFQAFIQLVDQGQLTINQNLLNAWVRGYVVLQLHCQRIFSITPVATHQPPECLSHILSDCSLALYPPKYHFN
jgi:hypothetical protein